MNPPSLASRGGLPCYPPAKAPPEESNHAFPGPKRLSPGTETNRHHQQDDLDDEELSPREYGRRYGLTTPYQAIDPLQITDAPPSAAESLADLNGSYWDRRSEQCERWDMDKDTAQLLASVLDFAKDQTFDEMQELNSLTRFDNLKLEEALLASDPEFECMEMKRRNKATICTKDMPPFRLDDEAGEGFAWASHELRAVTDADHAVASEKLEVSVEVLQYIRSSMEATDLEWDEMINIAISEEPTIVNLPRPLTPPLMPLSPHGTPETLNGPAGDMEFSSTPIDLCTLEAADLEVTLLNDKSEAGCDAAEVDAIISHDEVGDLLCSPWKCGDAATSTAPAELLSSMKIDTPLLSTDWTEHEIDECPQSRFAADLEAGCSTSETDLDRDIVAFMDEILEPSAMAVEQHMQNEELVDFDTILRVGVPSIPAVDLIVPWTFPSASGTQESVLQRVKDDLTQEHSRWTGVSKVERSLNWTPFPPKLGELPPEEFVDEAALVRDMQTLTFDDSIDIEKLLCKPDTLLVLDEYESDGEELVCLDEGLHTLEMPEQPAEHNGRPSSPTPSLSTMVRSSHTRLAKNDLPQRTNMQTLLRKRKLALESSQQTGSKSKRRVTDGATEDAMTTRLSGAFDGHTSVRGLSAFMQLHGIDVQPPKDAENSSKQPVAPVSHPETEQQPSTEACDDARATRERLLFNEGLPPLEATSVVVSSKLLQNRRLVRQITKALPSVELVERTALDRVTSNAACTGSLQQSIEEADMTISPSTGLILTTLQTLQQKPLPGQNGFFGIRERVSMVAGQYERLIVLISESRMAIDVDVRVVNNPLDEGDTQALSDFIAFTTHLDRDVEAYYVPGSGDAVVQWIGAAISRHSIPMRVLQLQHDETLWERLLRFAGLNAYAAQAVLAELRTMADASARPSLADLFAVGGAERRERFASTVEGARILRRLEDVIARGWNCSKKLFEPSGTARRYIAGPRDGVAGLLAGDVQ